LPKILAGESLTAHRNASLRNANRLSVLTQDNQQLLGKYNTLTLADCLPDAILLPEKPRTATPVFLQKIKIILSTPCTPFQSPPFHFAMSYAAAKANSTVLAADNFHLHSTITRAHTICTPGSEFRHHATLAPLLNCHPLWEFVQKVLTHGAELHFTQEPNNEQRLLENEAQILLNNHKKARDLPDIVRKSIANDVSHGFAIPICVEDITKIPGAMICPLGIVRQTTISSDGQRIAKDRLTHDQTFCVLESSKSVNTLLDSSAYPELIYGFCLRRIIYQILSLRHHYPTDSILISKFDIKSAFRRINYSGQAATRCIAVFDNIAYVNLRMTFGGSNCPTTWCAVSEIITDLANDLLSSLDWDHTTLYWRYQHLVPLPDHIKSTIPMAPCLDTLLLPEPRPWGSTDIFIDDAIPVFLNRPEYVSRATAAVPLAIDILSRPFDEHDSPPRDHMLALSKLEAEGAPNEIQIVLGWRLNTRSLIISLPTEKYTAWTDDINTFLVKKYAKHEELESLVGRLVHSSTVIPLSRFFLGDLRRHIQRTHSKWIRIKFTEVEISILQLWKTLLHRAHIGINLNLVSMRKPTNMTITDACPSGMGGFELPSGKAWRMPLPNIQHLPNNALEFIASVIGIWVALEQNTVPNLGSILAITDNSSCVCWLKKSTFNSTMNPVDCQIACKLATLVITNNIQLNAQHVPGSKNNLADALSRKFQLSEADLTIFARLNFPDQVPANFQVCPLPEEITCWVYSTLQLRTPSFKAKPNQPTKNEILPGNAGRVSSPHLESIMTAISTTSTQSTETQLQLDSYKPSEPKSCYPNSGFAQQIKDQFSAGLFATPLATWQRNSGVLTAAAPFTNNHATTSSVIPSQHN
jgi:hypothetical protein